MTALFETAKRERWSGSRALVPLDRDRCGNCGAGMLVHVEAVQLALFMHGGYGEAKRGRVRWCPACRWTGGSSQESLNPRAVLA